MNELENIAIKIYGKEYKSVIKTASLQEIKDISTRLTQEYCEKTIESLEDPLLYKNKRIEAKKMVTGFINQYR